MQPDSRLSNLPFHREAQGVLFIAALLLPSSDALFHCSGQERQGPGAREICTSSYCPRFRFTPAAFPCRAEPVEAVGQGGTWLCPSKTSQALKEQRKCAGEPSSAQSGTASLSTPGSSQLFNTVKHTFDLISGIHQLELDPVSFHLSLPTGHLKYMNLCCQKSYLLWQISD